MASSESGTTTRYREKKPWRKILYEDQGYPDDYVDSSFLEELKKNLHVRSYSYGMLVCASTSITQQLSSVGLFVAMFFNMEDRMLSPQVLWALASAVTVLGYVVNQSLAWYYRQQPVPALLVKHLKTCVLFQGFSAFLSPVLASLTETISTDTIYAMTALMFAGYLLFYNYHTLDGDVPGAVSLNAAVFASVCLASRLHTAWHAFTTVTISFEMFALWPILQNTLKEFHYRGHVIVTLVISLVCTLCLLPKTVVGAVLYLTAAIFVTFVCPAWLFHIQPLKNNIYGPWDEAVVKT
ncbi:phosphatidylinositol N-acetylglucosaminyltransferase subunit C [Aplysia californica]|uniref:Phosphatidylinositol N-acetylglucosaminyltransferase subunit C n=1 Tax=Aplysia californica TaxID=6500 RepID=A0ABM1AA66_APLCA|nr:phosphatidylinositol N-acetylglucosaminyltransferase subunit C [Aplysia californica]